MTIQIDITHGRPDASDIARARHVAESLLAGIDHASAAAEYERQWDEHGDADALTGLATVWHAASEAADRALTDGWADPDGAGCEIVAVSGDR